MLPQSQEKFTNGVLRDHVYGITSSSEEQSISTTGLRSIYNLTMSVEIRRHLQQLLDAKNRGRLEANIILFSEGVVSSEMYQWVGFVYGTDELRRPRLNIYYLQWPDYETFRPNSNQYHAYREMREGVVNLSLSVRPELSILEYYLKDMDSPQEATEYLQRTCRTEPEKLGMTEAGVVFERKFDIRYTM